MNNKFLFVLCFVFALSLGVTGCSQGPKANNSQEAIQSSKSLPTVEEQAQYLVSQANSFVNSQKFDQAVETAKYILANLDKNSADAKKILEDATAQMKKAAEGALDDMKKKIGGIGQ